MSQATRTQRRPCAPISWACEDARAQIWSGLVEQRRLSSQDPLWGHQLSPGGWAFGAFLVLAAFLYIFE